jgi:hypothetical protein
VLTNSELFWVNGIEIVLRNSVDPESVAVALRDRLEALAVEA